MQSHGVLASLTLFKDQVQREQRQGAWRTNGCKGRPSPNTSPRQGLASRPRSPWVLCHGWPQLHPSCRAMWQLHVKQPHLPGCVSAPGTCEGTSTQVNEMGRSQEPARMREGSEKTVLVEIPVLWGPTRLCCAPCRGDRQSAMSLWQHATGIQGGDSSWQGVPWSGTSHNLPWRRPQCVCHRQRCPWGPHHL